ncbi:ABC transporter permease [bacterium]|nr:ABC transporter permease [bacterium]
MFDLEFAIAAWRNGLLYKRTILKEDLDELERHVRDEVDAGVQGGLDVEQSFRQSINRMGHLPEFDAEYQKIYWGKLRKRGAIMDELTWRWTMLMNYVTIAWRLLLKHRTTSAINIFGLSVGLATCFLIFLFVSQERSFDSFHHQSDQIYRVYRTEARVKPPNKTSEGTPAPLGPTASELVPGIAAYTRWTNTNTVLHVDGENSNVSVFWADPSFLDMFDFASTEQERRALDSPESVVVTRSAAASYFKDGISVGESIDFVLEDRVQSFQVAAIVEDPPSNSSLQFEFIGRYGTLEAQKGSTSEWTSNSTATYVMLEDQVDPRAVEAGILPIIKTFLGEEIESLKSREWWQDVEYPIQYHLQPLSQVHLSPEIDSFYIAVSNPLYSYILLAIAAGVLFIASVNFIMLSVGKASTRAREVGMRKSLGATRAQLMGQFWGEALIVTSLSVVLGLFIAYFLLPSFNQLANRDLAFSSLFSPGALSVILLLTLVTGLVAGLYPAAVLSSFEPLSVLKNVSSKLRGIQFSRAMIICQFVVSVTLIAAVLVMQKQMRFIGQQDLGYDAEQVISVDLTGTDSDLEDLSVQFAEQIAPIPGVLGSSTASTSFGGSWSRTVVQENDVNHIDYLNRVQPSFLDVMGIDLVEGRNFSPELQSDVQNAVLINETFAAEMGWENPIGKPLTKWPGVTVIGVVKDFKFLSAKEKVPPMMLHMSPELGSNDFMLVRFHLANSDEVQAGLRKGWSALSPIIPYRSEFLDQRIQMLYESDRRWQTIINYTAILALIISGLGLFGMAALSIARRTKEIGIRKVLGASSLNIARLITFEFAALVSVAILIAIPLAHWVMNKWLSTFAFQIDSGIGLYLLSGLLTLAIALITVSFQTIRAANSNPVESINSD